MTGYRLTSPHGTHIDRKQPLSFSFNGKSFKGYAGDTLASALLANGVRLVGRSFKLHRPRGILSCGVEEPSGLVEVGEGNRLTPNTRLTDIALAEGMVAKPSNCWPSLEFDVAAINNTFAAFLPAGFYYKTFQWPNWHLFEPTIRNMAGMSKAPQGADPDRYDLVNDVAEVLVVGGGPAGTEAALEVARSGAKVLLIASGKPPKHSALAIAGVRILLSTTVLGIYDHHLVTALETLPAGGAARERLWKIRVQSIVLATGAFERPMVFPNNDLPGVMLASAVDRYIERFGVACGRKAVIAANADYAYPLAQRLVAAGIEVLAIVDRRSASQVATARNAPVGVEVLHDAAIVEVLGRKSVKGVKVRTANGTKSYDVDLVCSAGGVTPNVNLLSQAGGALRWDGRSAMFVPETVPAGVFVTGACAGLFDTGLAIEHARRVGQALVRRDSWQTIAPRPDTLGAGYVLADTRPAAEWLTGQSGKSFVDFQNDVATSDIDLAARENYRSVEHLKRYTTTGMGTDQGKTSNVNALVQLGLATGRAPAQVGTTKFRPPYKPVTLGAIAAERKGSRLRPSKQLAAHDWHMSKGALMEEFGPWMRPAAYPLHGESLEQAAIREAGTVRTKVGLFDGSPLGKLEIHGPDAAAFLDWMYLGTMSTLKVGSARYGAILSETGILMDDGIVARLADDRFWVNTSSGAADRTPVAFENWLQCEFLDMQVSVTPVTSQWGNVTVAGPRAWELLALCGFPSELAPQVMPHMAMREVVWKGIPVRVLRASFSGEQGYELNIPSSHSEELFDALWRHGQPMGVTPYGVEALQIMRIEKGYIHIGTDSDGASFPDDLGLAGPIAKKQSDFVGRRSLERPVALDPNRQQLVGLIPVDKSRSIPVGAHIVQAAPPSESHGFVTSSCHSVVLGHSIALARLTRGRSRIGERVTLFNLGQTMEAEVTKLPFVDPKGERLHAQ